MGKSRHRTVNFNELPPWQQDNQFILSGYVRETRSFVKSGLSLLYIHNESGNIYTHLVPGIILFGLLVAGIDSIFTRLSPSTVDKLVLSLFIAGAASCLSISGLYHLLKSHSQYISNIGNAFDYFGIIILIESSMISLIYYGLKPHPAYRNAFCAITSAFGLICSVITLDSRFRTPLWRPFRAKMFILYGLSGVLPIIGSCILYGWRETLQRSQVGWIILEGLLYIAGATIYAARIPERLSPGKYDIWFHSHQIFHVMVLLAAAAHGRGLYKSYLYDLRR